MICERCRHDNPAAARFCSNCGQALVRAAIPVASPGPDRGELGRGVPATEGERKHVTVLFADLRNSLELLTERDPEEARALLDAVLECMISAVHQYAGLVNQVMGDGIMALFGAPQALEDHAVRAAYAALRMQENVHAYAAQLPRALGPAIRIRVGLNSGEVVVRSIGSDLRMDYTAVGQTTHLAARMEQAATPGSILVTAETATLVEGFVTLQSLGPMRIKGLEAPIEVFEITGAGQARSRLQVAAARGLTPFVGRMAEMRQLVEALEHARAVRGRLIAVVGEAGVGKSRLLWELIHSAHSEGCTVLEGQAAPYAKEAPYAPIIDALRKHLGIDERKDPNEIRLQVANHLHARDRELATFVPAFLALLDVPVDAPDWAELDPLLRRARTIDGIRRLLLAESRRQPVVLVLEDLNWADSETNAVLASLVDMLPTTRILVIVSYRPEHGQRWSERAPFESELRLAPLLPGIIETLLDTLLGSDPGLAQLKDVLREQTAGNPLFLEESIQALVETDVLTGSRGAYRLSRPFGSIQIAPSLLALLASRIDRISPRDKQLLQSAAVIGKDVPVALLASIADLPADELHAALARLQAGEFLHERSLFPDLEYTFKHALTHEVAYGGLLKDRRRALHGRIVDAIVALHRDRLREHVERLAHHAQRSERWPEAVDFCWQAGRKAMARSANREAVAYFDQALAALTHRPENERTVAEAFEIRLDQRSALIPIGEFVRVFQILHELEALAERLGDVRKQGLVAALMSGAYPSLGRSDDAARYGERARTIATEVGDPVIDILASTYLAASYFFLGEYARSVACGERLVALLPRERGHDSFGVAIRPGVFGRGFLCWSLSELGRFAEAEAVACEALALADAVGHPQTVAAGLLTLGTFHVRRGDVARAIPPFERARELCQRHDIPLWRPVFASFLGYSLALSSRFDEAERLLRDAIEEASRMRLMVFHSQMIMWLGEACLLTGAVKEAATLAEEALRNTAERKEAGLEAWALRLAAEVATRHEPLDATAAETRYRDAMQRAERLGARPLVARCRLGLGVLYRRTGAVPQAREHLALAAGAFRDMQMPLWSERAETALHELRSAP